MAYRVIRRTRDYPFPRDMIWQALTDPDALADWLMPNDFRPEVGHEFTFQTGARGGFDGTVDCEVLALEAPHLWHISWRGGGIDTEVVIRLAERPDGTTRLMLEHSGFKAKDVIARMILGPGWTRILRLKITNSLKGD